MTEQMPEKIYRQFDESHDVYMSDDYALHIDRMTREDLHSKSEIALELAIRDQKVQALADRVAELEALVNGFTDLMNETDGVAGYHLNEEIATWQELFPEMFNEEVLGE